MGGAMRADDEISSRFFSYIDLTKRTRAGHSLRMIRDVAHAALAVLSGEFDAPNSAIGRGSGPVRRSGLHRACRLRYRPRPGNNGYRNRLWALAAHLAVRR
jgi:hypothetical protein